MALTCLSAAVLLTRKVSVESIYAGAFNSLPTGSVDCVRNDKGIDVASRKVQTPVLLSAKGDRAFAVVSAEFGVGDGVPEHQHAVCCRAAQLLPAHLRTRNWRRYPDSTVVDGNGVGAILWSPSGKRLLALISQWMWEGDADPGMKYILFSSGDHKAHEVPVVVSVWKHFKRECAAQLETAGWIDDNRHRIRSQVPPLYR